MYKLTALAMMSFSLSPAAHADVADDILYLPRMKCIYTQDSFYSEIIFKKVDSHPETKGFDGELRHYVIQPDKTRKLISGVGFKSVFYKTGVVSGLIGDVFGSTGTFTLTNISQTKTGSWRYSSTDLSGTHSEAMFKCIYGPILPRN